MRAWRCQWRGRWRRWLLISGGITPYCVFIFYFISPFRLLSFRRSLAFSAFHFGNCFGDDDCWLFERHTHTHTFRKRYPFGECRTGRASRNAESKAETTKPKLDFKTAVEINSNCFQFNFYFARFTSTSMRNVRKECWVGLVLLAQQSSMSLSSCGMTLAQSFEFIYEWLMEFIWGIIVFALNLYFLAHFNSTYFRQIVRTLLAFNTSVSEMFRVLRWRRRKSLFIIHLTLIKFSSLILH